MAAKQILVKRRKKEVEEETGYKLDKVKKVFESYMSPGSVTEILHFFIAEYEDRMKVGEGGGAEELCPESRQEDSIPA